MTGDNFDVLDAPDPVWASRTGHCGGCGLPDCHDGQCAEHPCRRCPDRWDEGWFCGADCPGSDTAEPPRAPRLPEERLMRADDPTFTDIPFPATEQAVYAEQEAWDRYADQCEHRRLDVVDGTYAVCTRCQAIHHPLPCGECGQTRWMRNLDTRCSDCTRRRLAGARARQQRGAA